MTDDEIREVVRKYIIAGYKCDNADCLHAYDEFYASVDQDSEGDLQKAYALYLTAKVTVTWE